MRDVTQRRTVEQELRQSEERLRLVARATSDAVWDWNVGTDVVWVGEGFQTLFGTRADEPLRAVDAWAERVHPDDRERVRAGRADRGRERGEFWSDEYRFRRGDGSYADVFDRGYVPTTTQWSRRPDGRLHHGYQRTQTGRAGAA